MTAVMERPLVIGWKLASLVSTTASVRYRAMLPMLALEAAGTRCRVFASAREDCLDGLDVLVIVKSLRPEDLVLAQTAVARGILVVYDLCDNVFIENYTIKAGLSAAAMFLSIAAHANRVVTTTEPLAAEIRSRLPDVPVVVIPDGIETPALTRDIAKRLRAAQLQEDSQKSRVQLFKRKVRNVIDRVRDEGAASIPPLLGLMARRTGHAAVHQLRRGLGLKARKHAAATPALRYVPGEPGTKRIVWFGNHGAPHARFGMLDILEYKSALETIAGEFPVELVVVSNNREKYEENIRPLRISSRYVEWSPKAVEQCLADAAVVIVPNTLDRFSLCKSANRTVLSFAHSVPVVATPTPALEPLAAFCYTGDPLQGLRTYLADPAKGREDGRQGYRLAEVLFGQAALADAWLRLLRDIPRRKEDSVEGDTFMAVVLHLIQDLDLAVPILRAARQAGVVAEAWCSTSVFKKSPRVLATLKAEQLPFKVLAEDQRLASLRFPREMRVLLTVAETSLSPHRFPRELTEAAAGAGLLTATLQHGYENVGLTYEDAVQSLEKVQIAAQRIYTWGRVRDLHPRLPASVRARCVAVGCPKDVVVDAPGLDPLLPRDRVLVGIFENLHWHRYDDAYRAAFIANVLDLARTFPHVGFLVKPHHAGLWLTGRYEGERPVADNLIIADPKLPEWEQHTATAMLARLSAVITTPSTVALDAARLGLPVALYAGMLDLAAYRPLRLLKADADWKSFITDAVDPDARDELELQSEAFVERVLVPGDAAGRILEDLMETVGMALGAAGDAPRRN